MSYGANQTAYFLARMNPPRVFGMLSVLLLLGAANTCWGLPSAQQHAQAMKNDFGLKGSEATKAFKAISSIIDDAPRGLKSPRLHRSYGHWGWRGPIPFDADPVLKQRVQENPSFKKELIDRWRTDKKQMVQQMKNLGITTPKHAKALTGLAYSHHLLMDYQDKITKPLALIEQVQKDIIEDAADLFGKRSHKVAQLRRSFKSIPKSLSNVERVTRIIQEYRKLGVGEQILKLHSDKLKSKGVSAVTRQIQVQQISNMRKLRSKQLPKRCLRAGANAAQMAAIFSAAINGYQWSHGDLSTREFVGNVAEDTTLAGLAGTVSFGILEQVGEKFVLAVPLNAAASAGLGVFIFDGVRTTYLFVGDQISVDEFIDSNLKTIVKSGASASATYVAVLLGASPGGPVVMAVSIGGYVVGDLVVRHYERLQQRKHFHFEDIIGRVPLAIKNRKTAFEPPDKPTAFEPADRPTAFEPPERPTAFDPPSRPTPFN